jgi:DNA-binding GntR family transcriptional regulator
MAGQQTSKTAPLSERVYDRLCADLVAGRITPGDALVQEQLAESYGVSRTPVRDALNRLVLEGLAQLTPGAGYTAAELTPARVAEVYEVRRELEALAIRQFGASFDDVTLARLDLNIAEGAAAESPEELFTATRAFHLTLVSPTANSFLITTLEAVWDNPLQRVIGASYDFDAAKLERVAASHKRIVETARAGDLDLLLQLLAGCHRED